MKKILILLSLLLIASNYSFSLPKNDYIVPLCRQFSKELFDINAEPFLSPTLSVVNATSNSGFYHSAYVPAKVKKPYFRIALNMFGGFVSDNMKTFTPKIPSKEWNDNYNDLLPFFSNGIDTVGLLNYFFLNIMGMGIKDKVINIPEQSSTLLGGKGSRLIIPDSVMRNLIHQHPLYRDLQLIAPGIAEDIEDYLMPGLNGRLELDLPSGGNLNTIIAGVPQLEVGALFGTEILIRFIPPVDFGEYVGKFSFWGIGFKHSISQYFFEDKNEYENIDDRKNVAPIDIAVQAIYQRTSLTNVVGYTKAELDADANIYNININASKSLFNWLEIYSGISYEKIDIKGTYKYLLPLELQLQLGLMRNAVKGDFTTPIVTDPPEYPGDDKPQVSEVALTNNQIKFTIGVAATFGPVIIFADYNFSNFSIIGAGLQIKI